MTPLFRTRRRVLTHQASRPLLLVVLLTPVTLVFLLGVAWPAAHALRTAPEAVPETVRADTDSPEDRNARSLLLARADSLLAAEAFLNARLALARQDQVSLAVDLVDSVLYLEVQGVPVRRVPIRRFHASQVFERAKAQGRLIEWTGRPYTLERTTGTIPRIPIRVVEAPRDTTEANARPPHDAPVEIGATHAVLYFDRGLALRVDQPASASGLFGKAVFAVTVRAGTARRTLSRLVRGRAPEHEPWIALELSPEDARAVYRALPDHAGLALRF